MAGRASLPALHTPNYKSVESCLLERVELPSVISPCGTVVTNKRLSHIIVTRFSEPNLIKLVASTSKAYSIPKSVFIASLSTFMLLCMFYIRKSALECVFIFIISIARRIVLVTRRISLLFKREALVKRSPALVICHEGHRIKNSRTNISQALKQIHTHRCIVLTRYPLQNNLVEYRCMIDFGRPIYLGTKTEFCNIFEKPYRVVCVQTQVVRYKTHVLQSSLVGFEQKRSHDITATNLDYRIT
uniref:SNF2 N-terminal domain-containing protein n=1 Tax=Glossina palpalis gambiensis TaxID=67801 RepID=A0A1B0ARH1_9MUSC